MKKEHWEVLFGLTLAVCAVLLSGSVLVAAFQIGPHIATTVVVVIFQIVITTCGVVLSGAITWAIAWLLFSAVYEQIQALWVKNEALFSLIRKRVLTMISITTVITPMVMLIADKAFPDVQSQVSVALLLMILFAISNELMLREGIKERLGWIVWMSAVASLPAAIAFYYFTDPERERAFWESFAKVQLGTRVAFVLAILIALILPIAFRLHDPGGKPEA